MKSNQTIKNALNTDKETFKDLCDKMGLTQSELFSEILKVYTSNPTEQTTVNTDEITNELNNLRDAFTGLQTENQNIVSEVENLRNVNLVLNEKLTVLESAEPGIKLNGTQFIFEPSTDQYNKMKRCITFEITKGRMQKGNSNLPNLFTENAINYYIKNEYNHILK